MQGVQIVSFIPGRVRLKVAKLQGNFEFSSIVQTELTAVPAISSVEIHVETGSVLVKYDRRNVANPESLDPLCGKLTDLFPDIDIAQVRKWLTK